MQGHWRLLNMGLELAVPEAKLKKMVGSSGELLGNLLG